MRHQLLVSLTSRALAPALAAIAPLGVVAVGCGSPAPSDCASNSSCGDDAATDAVIADGATGNEGGGADASDGGDGGLGDADGAVMDSPTESGLACDAGIACNGQCVDPTQPTHCGSCSNVCPVPTNGAATCAMPTCGIQCNTGFHACNGACLPDSDDPSADACVISDAFGVFVSPSGSDSNACTKTAPCATITHGISVAHAANKRIYVCAGAYAENVVINASSDGAQVFGGFDCSGWAYSASNSVKVQPGSGYALKLDTLTTGTRLEDIEFDGPNGANPGDSSIAVFANAAQVVTLKRVVIKSGNGVAGAGGAAASNYDTAMTTDNVAIAGHDANLAAGGPTQACTGLCANGIHSTGGKGGNGGDGVNTSPSAGLAGQPGLGGTPPNDGAGGLGGGACGVNGSGHNGASASASAGGNGAATNGMLSASGWTPAGGSDGTIGGSGQGGGGGGGGISATRGGGAGGGCGGCGGAFGTGGKGGGSSFALVSFSSSVTLDSCTLTAGNAGGGGAGGTGQSGQLGGIAGNAASPGCSGGSGGAGGAGGGGGGGAGGHSVAIAYSGAAPTEVGAVSKVFGAAGAAGAAGSPGATAGVVGVAQMTKSF